MDGQPKPPTAKHPKIYEDDTARVYFECLPEYECIFLHIEVLKLRPKHYRYVLEAIKESVKRMGLTELHAYTEVDDDRTKKMANMFGFTSTKQYVNDENGMLKEVFVCHLQ